MESFCLSKVWELADTQKNGYLTRDGLYKAFALIALSQQGKNISEKSLELLIDAGNIADGFLLYQISNARLIVGRKIDKLVGKFSDEF